jgi:hypothetical protein
LSSRQMKARVGSDAVVLCGEILMVKRRRFTPEFVQAVPPPQYGEMWIADTKLRGFGLRLWATKSGGNKAFAVRVVNADGRSVRKTFNLTGHWPTDLDFAYGGRTNTHGLGEYLEDARNWARDEIDNEKRRLTVNEEYEVDFEDASDRIQLMTLEKAAQSLISGMRANGRSEKYVARLDKLFYNSVSKKLRTTALKRLSAKAVAKCLVNVEASAGNIRILRSFVSQIFERAANFHGPFLRFQDQLGVEFRKQWDRNYDVRYPELRRLKKSKFRKIFGKLESEKVFWQAALCIRLFFEFHSPVARVLSARWDQIDGDHWYPYLPNEKIYWYESRERIGDVAASFLQKIKERNNLNFPGSPFWFPRPSAPATR